MDFIGYRKERLKDFLSKRYRFPIFDLSDTVLDGVFEHFKTKKFDYINGYTSSIVLFGKYLQARNIVLTDVCPTLKVCMVTSEMLFEEDKILLEKHLGIPVVNEYGASELDLIAFQNIKDEWQVNSETLFVEILDENGDEVVEFATDTDTLEKLGVEWSWDYEADIDNVEKAKEWIKKGKYVAHSRSIEKGSFFEADIELTEPFDISKLKLSGSSINDWAPIIDGVMYDNQDCENYGGDTNGKGLESTIHNLEDWI